MFYLLAGFGKVVALPSGDHLTVKHTPHARLDRRERLQLVVLDRILLVEVVGLLLSRFLGLRGWGFSPSEAASLPGKGGEASLYCKS